MSENRKIRFKTNMGEFVAEMFEDKAPKTTENFISLVEKKFYDVEMFIKKTNDDVQFPIIGYKHRSKEVFSFTKDRAGA